MEEDNSQYKRFLQIGAIILIILLVLILLYILIRGVGGGDNTPDSGDSVVPSDQQITLIWWNMFETQENMQPLIDAYQAIHPNVTIEYSEKSPSDYQTNLDTVLTDVQPATSPDIFTIHNSMIGRYRNYLSTAPSQVTDAEAFQSTFYPVVYQDNVYNGVPYAIPLGIDSLALVYNKDLLSAKGYTVPSNDWTELLEQAKNMTQKNANGEYQTVGMSLGVDEDNPESNEFWFDIFNLLLLQSEVQMVDSTGMAAFADDTATLEAVDYIKNFSSEGVWNASLKQDVALFLEGKLAMYIAPSWRLLDIIAYNEEYDLGLDIGVTEVPQLSSLEEDKVSWATYWVQGVSIDSSYPAVAWDFLNFATQPEQLRLVYEHVSENRAFGQIYPVMDMKSELVEDKYLGPYVEAASTAKSWDMVDGSQVKDSFMDWLAGGSTADSAQTKVNSIINGQGELSPL